MDALPTSETDVNRKRAVLAILPFVAIGLADVLLLLVWGLDPLWGFMILPPILGISILGYIAFKHGFVRNIGTNRYEGEETATTGYEGEETATNGYEGEETATNDRQD